MPNELTSCSGQCCRSFTLSVAPDATGLEVIEILKGHDPERRLPPEASIIGPMLIPLAGPYHKDKNQARFTCKNLTPTGCGIYNHRPRLCRRHGVDYRCDYKDCTFDPEPWLIPAETLTRPRKGDAQGVLVPQVEPVDVTNTEVTDEHVEA